MPRTRRVGLSDDGGAFLGDGANTAPTDGSDWTMTMRTRTATLIGTLLLLMSVLDLQAFYNPGTGKWINRDPLGERGGANLYGIVDNSPVNHFDAFGLQAAPLPVPPTPTPPIVVLPPPGTPPPPNIIPFPGPPRPIGPPQVALCVVVFAGTYYVTYQIADATGAHDALGDLIGDLIAPPLMGGATGTHPRSPFPAGSRDPLTLARVNPGPCGKCGNGCKPCPPNSPAWEVNEPAHGSTTTHWHWIEYHQVPASYKPRPGGKTKPCDCIPVRQSSPTKPPGA
jgi:hypothetical protein